MPNRRILKRGFSTGSGVTAALMAAVKAILGLRIDKVVAIRLPLGFYIPVPVNLVHLNGTSCIAEVKKDGGDDPDITHGAIIRAQVSLVKKANTSKSAIWLDIGEGIGIVTKPGLPLPPGEPAVNPVPRKMIVENVSSIFLKDIDVRYFSENLMELPPLKLKGRVSLPLETKIPFDIYSILSIPGGEDLAKKTLNPRLGIVGGLSVLGTNGLVTPFSHEAYEETIDYALRFAKTNGCSSVVLTTGGKSESYARRLLPQLPEVAFIQIADFFGFSVKKAGDYGFYEIVHAVFFGKAVKMALGFSYTHAREGLVEMKKLAHGLDISGELEEVILKANTAREVLEILKERSLSDLIEKICIKALQTSFNLCPRVPRRRIILFDYDGSLLCEESMHGSRLIGLPHQDSSKGF
ncbi:MAG: cobalt-precorrin-5B (C(1))-methyltransferase CbiD [Syntrophobacterales bacterium]|nr:cobalt-precorrin-5B (C(1))-methyltransferase CbiD [Syntrophobacterales bacterium]